MNNAARGFSSSSLPYREVGVLRFAGGKEMAIAGLRGSWDRGVHGKLVDRIYGMRESLGTRRLSHSLGSLKVKKLGWSSSDFSPGSQWLGWMRRDPIGWSLSPGHGPRLTAHHRAVGST